MTQNNETTLTRAMVDLAINTKAIPESARKIMHLSFFDWLTVSIMGQDEPVSRITRDMIGKEGGTAEATVFGQTEQVPARAAALVNGTISHALDYDDTHFLHIGHPSVGIIPAAAAIAEKIGASLKDTLDAALLGCEASCRIGAWLGRSHYQHGFHQTATAGCFGATLAASRLLNLGEEQTMHALGLAATRASGLKSQFGTMGKPYHAGMSASNGVEVALLAQAGFVSRPDGLECAQGFGPAHNGSEDTMSALDGIGKKFIFETVQHKFHACCHGTHAPLEALLQVRSQSNLNIEQIEAVDVTIHPRWLSVCDIKKPSTGLEAKFSFCLTTAMVLAGIDTASLATFSDEICNRADLVQVRDVVRVIPDDTVPETASNVKLYNQSGETTRAEFDLLTPLEYEAREVKVRGKAGSLLGVDNSELIWQRIDDQLTSNQAFGLSSLFQTS